jgi:hypothetical protein
MQINCLSTQIEFFETRILKRTFDVVFLDLENLPKGQTGPLILFGPWHPLGFITGLRWLSELSHELQHPCIILPPFESGSLSEAFRLSTSLNVQIANTNYLLTLPEAKQAGFSEQRTLKVQTDFTFTGSTGKAWATVGDPLLAALLCVQPKNTATPMLLCGARLLSASGLSDDEDRVDILEGIITWAGNWQQIPITNDVNIIESPLINDETWRVVIIVLTGCKLETLDKVNAFSSSIFGIDINENDIQLVEDRLIQLDLAKRSESSLDINLGDLEKYTQQNGLWAYVRALRKDFERTRS